MSDRFRLRYAVPFSLTDTTIDMYPNTQLFIDGACVNRVKVRNLGEVVGLHGISVWMASAPVLGRSVVEAWVWP